MKVNEISKKAILWKASKETSASQTHNIQGPASLGQRNINLERKLGARSSLLPE